MTKLFYFFLLISFPLLSQDIPSDEKIDYARSGDYFPYVPLTDEDSIYFPISFEIELHVADIYDLEVKNSFFTSKIISSFGPLSSVPFFKL